MVAEAVASVMAQRGVAFELIVVDDGSTDGTLERLRERFAAEVVGAIGSGDPRRDGRESDAGLAGVALPATQRIAGGANDASARRVRGESKIRLAPSAHRGPAAARNRGVAMARAGLIAFLDSDDLWMPNKLERQLAFMRRHPGCAIAQTREFWLRDGRRVNPGRRHRKRSGDIFIDSLRTCLISPSAVIMKRELFEAAGGFDERLAACEDYDLWLRLLVKHEVSLLDEALVIRRAGHPDQLSASTPALDRFRIVTLLKLMEVPALSTARRQAVAEVLAEKCLIYANGLARRNKFEGAAHYRAMAQRAMSNLRAPVVQAAIAQ